MLGTIILILDGVEKHIPLGKATIATIKAILALVHRDPDPATGETLTEAQVLAQIDAAMAPYQRIEQRAEHGTAPPAAVPGD